MEAKTILDLYNSGQRKRRSFWDAKRRDQPLPYAHSQRGKQIALEKAQKHHSHSHEPQAEPGPTFREPHSASVSRDRYFNHQRGPSEHDYRMRQESSERDYNNYRERGHNDYYETRKRERERDFSPRRQDQFFDNRGHDQRRDYRERYNYEDQKRLRYEDPRGNHPLPQQHPGSSLESRMNAISGGNFAAAPAPVSQLPQNLTALNSAQYDILFFLMESFCLLQGCWRSVDLCPIGSVESIADTSE